MPIGLDKAPQTLPKSAKELWIGTFNGVLEECKGAAKECDERAARIAWENVKGKYRQVEDKWIEKSETEDAYHDLLLTITKASLQPDGTVRWQAVASDTGKDKAGERTSVDLFQDWIDRVTFKSDIPYLPKPKMPFLGVSHYPALDGAGEAGVTRRMYIDGSTFKADGVFLADSPVGGKLLEAVKSELAIIKKGDPVEKPIRISAGWWDIQHLHEDSNYLFTRQSLADKCPLCEKGQTTDKIYKAGQLDHFAATRVPMNPRTHLELKSMANKKITRMEDAESIIGAEGAEALERQARLVGKSDTEEGVPEAMVIRGDMGRGGYMAEMRRKKKMKAADVAKALKITEARLKRLEEDEDEMDDEAMEMMAAVLQMSDEEKEDMLARFGKKRKKMPPSEKAEIANVIEEAVRQAIAPLSEKAMMKTVGGEKYPAGDFLVVEDSEAPSTWHLQVKRNGEPDHGLMGAAWAALHKGYRGNIYEGPMKAEAIGKLKKLYGSEKMDTPTEKMDYGEGEEMHQPMMPLGGALSIKEAEDYIAAKEKMGRLYSYWDLFQTVTGNIMMAGDETDKVKAMGQAVKDLGMKIDTLKAGLSDAFLIQESAAAYDDDDDYLEEDDYEDAGDEIITEENEVNIMTPEERLQEARKAALEDQSLTRKQREAAIQKAFNEYAAGVQGELEKADPIPVGDQIAQAIKGSLADVLGPLTEQVGLLTAKMAQQEQQAGAAPVQTGMIPVHVPQQKSMATPTQTPQPVQGGQPGHHVSPVTGKPSALSDYIRKSVGLHN